jgi:hypothetical protein
MQALTQAFRDDAIPVGLFYKELRPTLESHTRITQHTLRDDSPDFDVQSLLEIYR